ncbi:MAG: mucoidy inhibitor MuiA family protein [Chitinophagaceae bacterium]|nr:mucoidy inhibitor MuiA family protein [Chitinophagaceae bacterium]
MKQWMHLLLLVLPFTISAQTTKRVTLETKMEKVTVFLKGAQVLRTGKQLINNGKQEIVFRGISTDIEKNSVQVKADGKLTVLSVKVQRDFLNEQEVREEIKDLQTKQEQLEDKKAATQKMLEVFKQEENMLIKNQQIGGTIVTLKPEELRQSLEFQRTRLTEVLKKQLELGKEIEQMDKEQAKLASQLRELNQKKDLSTNEIVLLADVKENAIVPFEITYLVKKAGWYPSYNIRVKDVVSPLTIEMNANVYQTSGEGWNNVKLILSTGNPNENNTKPEIKPWYLYYVDGSLANYRQYMLGNEGQMLMGRITDDKGMPLAGATVQLKGTVTGTSTDANGVYKIKANGFNQTLSVSYVGFEQYEFNSGNQFVNVSLRPSDKNLQEVVVVGYGTSRDQDLAGSVSGVQIRGASTFKERKQIPVQVVTTYQPTTTQYEIDEVTTINNDGKMNTISIHENSIAAYYEYYTAPKLEEAAYLTAKLTNWQDLNLIPGETNLFFEGTYLGKSYLDLSSGSDTLSLSLGIDKGIVVKRTMLKEFSNKKFLGSNRTDYRHFELTVRNNKTVPVNIIIEDQFPISPQKEIEVGDAKYEGAKIDEDTKIITWSYIVESKQQKKMELKYSVKYPKEKHLQLD